MNIFKNVLKITMVVTLLFLLSCEKDQNESTDNSQTKEINKIVTKFKEGDIKLENTVGPDFQKKETSMDDNYKKKIRLEIEKTYSKQSTYLKSAGNRVGVIKSGSCGPYQVLEIRMDCEDTNNNSGSYGWTGECFKNSVGNVTLKFCVVTGAYFERTNVDYAVLNFSNNGLPYGVNRITRYIDNEDRRNINQYIFNEAPNQEAFYGWYGNDCYWDLDTRFGFYHYPHVSSSTPFPNLGISYGVFGRFGNFQGWIKSDDEDDNGNWAIKQIWSNYILQPETYVVSVDNIFDGGVDTKLYMSKVN